MWVASVADLENRSIVFDGYVGEVRSTDTNFTFELRSRTSRLDVAISEKVDSRCDYRFCDAKCGLNINNFTSTGFAVSEFIPQRYAVASFRVQPWPSGDFRDGVIEFTSGRLKGARFDVRDTSGGEIRLTTPLPAGLAIGDTLKIERGCAKTPQACEGYNNSVNFGGFPTGENWMPGTEIFTKAP
jgi:uncharacterized phage protein (TIGR02218 family)